MPRDVLTPEFAGRGGSQPASARRAVQRIDIPGIGPVNFPASMSEEEISAAAAKLHAETNTQTATTEQFAPAPRMTRLAGDPSTGGFVGNLLSGAKDAVTNLPKTIKGLTKINPLELPGQIATGIKDRVQSYADDPLSTIYDDPLSFLGDAATMTGIGSAVSGPVRAGARGVASAAGDAASSAGRAVRRANVTASDVVKGGAKSLVSREMPVIGAVRQSVEAQRAARMAREALGSGRLNTSRVETLDDILTQALEDARMNPAPTKIGGSGSPLPGKSPALRSERVGDMIATQPDKKWGTTSLHTPDRIDDALRAPQGQLRTSDSASPFMMDKMRASGRFPQPPAAQASLRSDAFTRNMNADPQRQSLVRELMNSQDALIGREAGPLSRAGRTMLTPDEEAKLLRALGMQ